MINDAGFTSEIKARIAIEKKKNSTGKRLFSPANWTYI
jgi:hypothetical protein